MPIIFNPFATPPILSMKRAASPSHPTPTAKRLHTEGHAPRSQPASNFDSSLYDELVLVIFSYLSWADLCAIQRTNHYWSRLASDNQLWKRLYMQEYGRPRLRGSRGYIAREDGREVKPLPSRIHPEDITDWKWMFRISSNWRNGRCTLQTLEGNPYSSLLKSVETPTDLAEASQTHVILSGALTFTSSPQPSQTPSVFVHKLDSSSSHALLDLHRRDVATHITFLSLDQSPPASHASELHLTAFYDTGEFTVFAIDHNNWPRHRILCSYSQPRKTERTSPIITAVYHHPLLITLSRSFHLSLYNLSGQRVVHTQTLTSFTSFHPTSLVLSTTSPSSYKLVLAYSKPVYPAHWSVASTELTISSAKSSKLTAPCTVIATRTTGAFDMPSGWIDDKKYQAVREQWGRKVGRVADTQTDGKWVVLASADDSTAPVLQLYRLHLPGLRTNASPKLAFVRSLHGHTGPISSLCVADGRCVSLGADGSLWVWDLESTWSAEVQTARTLVNAATSQIPGTVVFDDKKIITVDANGIEVRRFDI